LANELEFQGVPFPASELEAFGKIGAELREYEAEHGPVERIEPPVGLSDADALAAINRVVWDGTSLAAMLEDAWVWCALEEERKTKVRLSDAEEVRIEWVWRHGFPFLSVQLWTRDRAGRWRPDPKSKLSIRVAELRKASAALKQAIRLAEQAARQGDSQDLRPRCAQPEGGHDACRPPYDRAFWIDVLLPSRTKMAQEQLSFSELE
jgi:hypothetical protein